MKSPAKGRKGESALREEWTARLNRFAGAKTAKQRQAAIEPELKINPGGAIRNMLGAWGFSTAGRGRKAKAEQGALPRRPGREQLESILDNLYGAKPAPVPNLNKKLAGSIPATVKDACRIVAAMAVSWPDPMPASAAKDGGEAFAESFIRELLSDLSGGRSYEWDAGEMEIRVFNLIDEERIGASQLIKDAGESDGALIVASARNILIGANPVKIIHDFHSVTSGFIASDQRGILIFVFDAALFEAGEDGYRLLYNIGLLSTAITAFSLFDRHADEARPIRQHKVDWSRWRTLSRRCCAVIRKPTLVDQATGELLKGDRVDQFIANLQLRQDFAQLGELEGFVRFDGSHVLPRNYPPEWSGDDRLGGRELYWDVAVRSAGHDYSAFDVQYFTPPPQAESTINGSRPAPSDETETPTRTMGAGRPPKAAIPIEEDFFYVVKRDSPGTLYDEAQRTIYMAARARLGLDSGARHVENLNAAAALREVGFEVLPISALMSLFPASLDLAAANEPRTSKRR